MFTYIKKSVLKRLPVNILENVRFFLKNELDVNGTQTVFGGITLVLIDVLRKESKNMSVSVFCFFVFFFV